ncbi:hypothetical protein EWM64_g2892 [Hericium alpestre]|uniref:USP domain-containing protein n=1 Tax=Hericium alpestre TaxID=135208 RepID=A0A4Z0A239_9AGAM|nr:hypothetical protein EWM64_g2892 [Hericium alpestre]
MASAEDENVEQLVMMMGGDLDPNIVRGVLRKVNGDMQKAATELLNDPTGGSVLDSLWSAISTPGVLRLNQPEQGQTSGPRTPPPSRPERHLEATHEMEDVEDKDLRQALEASMQTESAKLVPSDRAPDPNWAMVPSNVEIPPVSQEVEIPGLDRAIQESLDTYKDYANETIEELPLEKRVRKDGRPVSLRPTQGMLAFAGLLVQGLFFVPQVRESLAKWRPSPSGSSNEDLTAPTSGPEHMVWTLVELFANMDLAALSELNVDAALKAFSVELPAHAIQNPGDITYQFMNNLAWITESVLHKEVATQAHQWSRLFHFRYGSSDAEPNLSPLDKRYDTSVVKVDVRDEDKNYDLISALSSQLSHDDMSTRQHVIFEPSDVVSFHLVRHESLPSYSGGQSPPKQRFRYPKHIYLDQFMRENAEFAASKRAQQKQILEEIQRLTLRKAALTHANNKDTLKDLRSSVYYFENVANKDDPERKASVGLVALKIRKILTRIENELETIDNEISKLKVQSAGLFEGSELRQHQYDLRVVLVHDGLPGRNHLYSYVQHLDRWWKTVDYTVTEVPEDTVLNDPTGLHLNAGPYMLIYSRTTPDLDTTQPLSWPEDVKNSVKHNNQAFLAQLPLEAANQARNTSPPTSPYQSYGSQWDTPSSSVEPPSTSPGRPDGRERMNV